MQKKPLISLILAAFLLFSFFYVVPKLVFANPDYEDFTTYTEVDPSTGKLAVSAERVTATNILYADVRYVYDDKGEDYFTGDFVHLIDVCITDSVPTSGYGRFHVWSLWNSIGATEEIRALDDGISVFFYSDNALNERLYLREFDSNNQYSDYMQITEDVIYYLKIERIDDELTCKVYSDSDREEGNLINTLTLTLHQVLDYQYVYGGQSVGLSIPSQPISCWLENLDLQEEEEAILVTFYLNDGGKFYVNATDMANSTSTEYENETMLVLMAVPANFSYIFVSFNWTASSSISNPHEYTVLGNDTIWLLFDGAGAGDEDFTDPGDLAVAIVATLICLPLLIIFLWALTRRR